MTTTPPPDPKPSSVDWEEAKRLWASVERQTPQMGVGWEDTQDDVDFHAFCYKSFPSILALSDKLARAKADRDSHQRGAIQALEQLATTQAALTQAQSRADTAEARVRKLEIALVDAVEAEKSVKCYDWNASYWNATWDHIRKVALATPPATATSGVEIQCDGRAFPSSLDAALHLLWLLQRLSFYEPEREGMPCDGFRFRQGIIAARKLLESLNYESCVFGEKQLSAPSTVETEGDCRCLACGRIHFWNERTLGPTGGHTHCPTPSCSHACYETPAPTPAVRETKQ